MSYFGMYFITRRLLSASGTVAEVVTRSRLICSSMLAKHRTCDFSGHNLTSGTCRCFSTTVNRKAASNETASGDLKVARHRTVHDDASIDVFTPQSVKTTLGKLSSEVIRETIYTRQRILKDDPLVAELLKGIREGSRSALARSITLVESLSPRKRAQAQALLREVLEDIRQKQKHSIYRVTSFRIGLSGPPGAGKSTHIEALGKLLTSRGHKVAVLAVDPSSSTSGGSLLGDKTRMPELSCDPNAYIRPSPSAGNLGGVTRVTNDAIVLCEGAGYDIILVETVGVGQSEYAVADMVDMFELILPPAGGDELQGIKKGIVEVADIVVINKCDGDLIPAARRIQMEYTSALKFVRPKSRRWRPTVMSVSSVTKTGLIELWDKMKEFRNKLTLSGDLERRREKQHVLWMRNHINDNIRQLFNAHPAVKQLTPKLEFLVEKGAITPGYAADILLCQFSSSLATADISVSQSVADELMAAERHLFEEMSGGTDDDE